MKEIITCPVELSRIYLQKLMTSAEKSMSIDPTSSSEINNALRIINLSRNHNIHIELTKQIGLLHTALDKKYQREWEEAKGV